MGNGKSNGFERQQAAHLVAVLRPPPPSRSPRFLLLLLLHSVWSTRHLSFRFASGLPFRLSHDSKRGEEEEEDDEQVSLRLAFFRPLELAVIFLLTLSASRKPQKSKVKCRPLFSLSLLSLSSLSLRDGSLALLSPFIFLFFSDLLSFGAPRDSNQPLGPLNFQRVRSKTL